MYAQYVVKVIISQSGVQRSEMVMLLLLSFKKSGQKTFKKKALCSDSGCVGLSHCAAL